MTIQDAIFYLKVDRQLKIDAMSSPEAAKKTRAVICYDMAIAALEKQAELEKSVLGISKDKLAALLDEAKEAAWEYAGSLNNGFGAWYADYLLKHQEKLTGNRLTEMPCQVGDSLWCLVGSDCSVVMEMTVENIFINKMGIFIGLSGGGKYQEIYGEDVGRTAFWSEMDAIAAREECLKVVDDLIEKAAKRSGAYDREYAEAVLDAMDNRPSGLFEEFC